jgi:RNA polymerase sigma-70 factor (ECF subfamily)
MLEQKFTRNDHLFESLINSHSNKLQNYALYLTKNADDADDLYQETLIKIYINLHMYENLYFPSWSKRIMLNLFLDKQRKKKKIITTSIDTISPYEHDFIDDSINIESDTIENIINNLNSDQLKHMINDLNPKHRECLSLYLYGTPRPLSYKNTGINQTSYIEISQILNIPLNTVRTRLLKAREALLKIIESQNKIFN